MRENLRSVFEKLLADEEVKEVLNGQTGDTLHSVDMKYPPDELKGPTVETTCYMCHNKFQMPAKLLEEIKKAKAKAAEALGIDDPNEIGAEACCHDCSSKELKRKNKGKEPPIGDPGDYMERITQNTAVILPVLAVDRRLEDKEWKERAQQAANLLQAKVFEKADELGIKARSGALEHEQFKTMVRTFFEAALDLIDNPPQEWLV
jgi:hypothetical protein